MAACKNTSAGRSGKGTIADPFVGLTDVEIGAMDEGVFADALWKRMEQRGPMLTYEQMDEIEAMWERERASRRVALVMLTMPWAELQQRVFNDREFAVAAAQVKLLVEDVGMYRGLVECMEQVRLWVAMALCGREDREDVLADGEAAFDDAESEEAPV